MGAALGTFGKYFLTERLATGGMAEIYLAKLIGPSGFEKQLVIKQIHPELAGDERFVDLLVAEAKTLVALSHGNIVPVYELGVVDGTYFIAMEYVDGPTLEELSRGLAARGEALPVEVAAYIAAELSRGLDHAHRKGDGLVHRDLSPRNVMLSREGEIKLLDFGIALPMSEGGARSGAQPAGSVPYMSPEQARCEPLDARSDLFSAGVLLWELLTGEPLFAREDVAATLTAVREGPVPAPSALRAGVPAELDRLCARALERDREARVQSAAEWLRDLQRYLYSSDEPVGPPQISRLVARVCPPLAAASRRPTTADAHSLPDGDATPRLHTARMAGRGFDGGERTRPLPRARGKPARGETVRSFATRADFAAVFAQSEAPKPPRAGSRARWAALLAAVAGAALLVAVALPGSSDDAGARSTSDAFAEPARGAARAERGGEFGPAAIGEPAALAHPAAATESPASAVPTERGAAGEAAPALAPAAAVEPAAVDSTAAAAASGPVGRAGTAAASAPAERTGAAPTGGPPQASDGAAAADAAERGAERARPVARERRHPGTLRVGADPWADVYVDGARIGRAPGAWPIAAGRHRVEVRFGEQRREFAVEIAPGELESLGVVDFGSQRSPPSPEVPPR